MAFPTAATKPVKSWSFSRWGSYDACPLKFKLTALDKLPEPKGAALERGAAIHDLASGFLKGTIAKLPPELANRAEEFKRLRARVKKAPKDVVVEDTWAFRQDWAATTWDDWDGCWVRIKLDVAEVVKDRDGLVLDVTDWKTGKYRPDDLDDYLLQLGLYGLGGLLTFLPRYPTIRVRPRLVYLDHDVIHDTGHDGRRLEFSAADVPRLKKEWEVRVKPMFVDKTFAPKPNQWCRTCWFRKDNPAPDAPKKCRF